MPETFPDCYFCGGEVRESRIVREVWRKGALHIVEHVPAGVCRQCGEKFITPNVAGEIDALLADTVAPHHMMQVPAYSFHDTEASQ